MKSNICPGANDHICMKSVNAVRDTMYVLNGKWKFPIIIALHFGPRRFNELQKALEEITPKILTKELKDMELNELVIRKVYPTTPVIITYELSDYSKTLSPLLSEMREWGINHKKYLNESRKKSLQQQA